MSLGFVGVHLLTQDGIAPEIIKCLLNFNGFMTFLLVKRVAQRNVVFCINSEFHTSSLSSANKLPLSFKK